MLVNSLVLYDYFAPVLGIIMALSIWSGGGGVRSADHLSHLLLHFQHPTLFVSHVADAALTAQPFQILMTMPSVICRATLSLYLSVFVITLSFIFFFFCLPCADFASHSNLFCWRETNFAAKFVPHGSEFGSRN